MPSRRSLLTMLCIASILFGMMLSGCAVTGGGPPTLDRYKPFLRMGVSLAVDRLLVQQPELVPMTVQTAKVLIDMFDAGQFTSIVEVGAFVRAHIPWDRIGADVRPLIEALLVGIGEELRQVAEIHQIPQTQAIVLVKELLTWVKEAAERHMVAPVRVQRVRRAS